MRREKILELISEISDEMAQVETLVSEINQVGEEMGTSTKLRNVFKESLALKLHNFYAGYERIFRRIADDINGGVPKSTDWHKRLLKSMSIGIEDLRPAVISRETAAELEDFLGFRHVVRNVYGFELKEHRILELVEKASKTFESFKKDLQRFLEFLRALS